MEILNSGITSIYIKAKYLIFRTYRQELHTSNWWKLNLFQLLSEIKLPIHYYRFPSLYIVRSGLHVEMQMGEWLGLTVPITQNSLDNNNNNSNNIHNDDSLTEKRPSIAISPTSSSIILTTFVYSCLSPGHTHSVPLINLCPVLIPGKYIQTQGTRTGDEQSR